MKRNVIVTLAAVLVVLAGIAIVQADDPPVEVVLGPIPVRVVAGQTYIVTLPPAETGMVAKLILTDESADWDAPVNVGGNRVSVPPSVSYSFEFVGIPGQESQIIVTKGSFPWSGGQEGTAWASVYYTQTKAVVQYNNRAQHVDRKLPR